MNLNYSGWRGGNPRPYFGPPQPRTEQTAWDSALKTRQNKQPENSSVGNHTNSSGQQTNSKPNILPPEQSNSLAKLMADYNDSP